MIDIDTQINAVHRQVGGRTLDSGEARVVTISQSYDTTVADLWDACTNPERIPRWFLPVTGELRRGGRFQLEGNAGGLIERCDPPTGFATTWEFDGAVSWIEVGIVAAPAGGARLELHHLIPDGDARWAEFGPGAVGVGWDMGFLGLGRHLSSSAAMEAGAWGASEEARRFMTLSAEQWCDASIADGMDPVAARAAADRTVAAYTGSA